MDKLISILRLEPWSGSRTKIGILVAGMVGVLHDVGFVPENIWDLFLGVGPFVLAYFGIEHVDKYFKVKQ